MSLNSPLSIDYWTSPYSTKQFSTGITTTHEVSTPFYSMITGTKKSNSFSPRSLRFSSIHPLHSLSYTYDGERFRPHLNHCNSLKDIERIRRFKNNWDGYGSRSFKAEHIDFVESIIRNTKRQAEISPTSRGSIVIKYKSELKSVIIEIFESSFSYVVKNKKDLRYVTVEKDDCVRNSFRDIKEIVRRVYDE